MQTDFFDAIAAGVLAGHKRKSRWDDGPLHTSSKRLKQKPAEPDSDDSLVSEDEEDDEPEEKPKRAPIAKRAKKQPAGRNKRKGKTSKGKGKAVQRGTTSSGEPAGETRSRTKKSVPKDTEHATVKAPTAQPEDPPFRNTRSKTGVMKKA
ncbi:hypothetical protein C8F01DRAFT_1115202 [Mycena amicta]|nr:hypothetical protein C8F01DRAFT_1115202 [Mycena amicta]